ncbi:Retrovirus-related Pol polyprotein from transposon RE1 [Vitis vinifera]|uniref:Retrovirus-related Pol polyprotein from transposon RE1 n=1 Tax=Vitis vinifera TaxID=29760 RepID=A0A438DHZ0_VITVI|nr:Retrovirus-related Pol polyprotein from transposon RE1 [Vitis vinifera]
MSTKLRVYTRRKFNSNTGNNQVNLEYGQSSAPSSQNLGNLPMDSTLLPIFDLDIPIGNPKREALGHSEWRSVVQEKMNALLKNRTWDIVDLPKEKKTVGCKWVFTIKCKPNGSIERYKARLVDKGFTQTYGIDHQETFAAFAKINSAITPSGQISLAISQSDHLSLSLSLSLSFRSSVPVLRAKGENAFRSVESSSETLTAPATFPGELPANFPATVFSTPQGSAWRRSPICPKAPEPETHPRAAHARFSGRRLASHAPARETLSGDALPPPGSPDADQPPFLPVCAI